MKTIENGAGEELTFIRVVYERDGDRLLLENRVQPGSGPPMHVHYCQEEVLTVIAGRMAYEVSGQEVRYAGPGETAAFAPGVVHRFWNAGQDELRCTVWVKPANNLPFYLTALFASMRRTGKGRPDPFDIAYLLSRYGSEFGVPALPAIVRKVVFPVQVAVGNMLGKFEKFKDAPAPLV